MDELEMNPEKLENEEAMSEAKIPLEPEMAQLYAKMVEFCGDFSFVTEPSNAFPALKERFYAYVFQMVRATPGFMKEEAMNRFYMELANFIYLMKKVDSEKLIMRLMMLGLFDKKLYNGMRKQITERNKDRKERKEKMKSGESSKDE